MPRFKLTLEYDGSNYAGWQRQAELHTIQEALEQVIFRFSGQQLTITTAGRTDAGVHATGQVAHVDFIKTGLHILYRMRSMLFTPTGRSDFNFKCRKCL